VVALCEKRVFQCKYIIVDTPGQIEIFTWSASGAIITEAFASSFPTVVAYVVDTPRCTHPQTFMSNMLQVSGGSGFAFPWFSLGLGTRPWASLGPQTS
jgi:GPN-loop GTPase